MFYHNPIMLYSSLVKILVNVRKKYKLPRDRIIYQTSQTFSLIVSIFKGTKMNRAIENAWSAKTEDLRKLY